MRRKERATESTTFEAFVASGKHASEWVAQLVITKGELSSKRVAKKRRETMKPGGGYQRGERVS